MSFNNYKRPKVTYTDTIQNFEKLKELTKDYVRVDCIDKVPLGTSVRYLTFKNNKQRFCIGGRLCTIHKDYVMLIGAKNKRFSVQRYHWKENVNKELNEPIFITIFWKAKFDCNSVNVKKLKKTIKDLEEENERLENYLIKLGQENKELHKIKRENIMLKKQLYQIQQEHPEMFN